VANRPAQASRDGERFADNPFLTGNDAAYARWRARKLEGYPTEPVQLLVPVADPRRPGTEEKAALLALCRKANMAIYQSDLGDAPDKDIPRGLGTAFGLRRLDPNMLADDDGITSLTVVEGKFKRGYIPYSDKRILWHTDGYYNTPERQIRAMVLHCVRPAVEGGENALLDHEMAYLLLRDEDPAYIDALMAPDAMTIPVNTDTGGAPRPAQAGPVFSVDPSTGALHMRYTARTRSIVWKDDAATRAAVARLEALLAGDSPYVFRYRLRAGEGLLCNNVLHTRTAFTDGPRPEQKRLLYRARYYDRIAGTGLASMVED